MAEKTLLALRISVNGREICVAALEDGAVTASVAVVGDKAPAARSNRKPAYASLDASGFRENVHSHIHPWWTSSAQRLSVGDEVLVSVVRVAASEISQPLDTHRTSKTKLRPRLTRRSNRTPRKRGAA
jgi:hypothetical protein